MTDYLVLGDVLHDGLGSGGELQGALGLLPLGGGDRADDGRLGVAAKRVLEDAGQLRVSEGDVLPRPVAQLRDDLAENQERLVDVGPFTEPLAFGR